jgi:hypothetical protein
MIEHIDRFPWVRDQAIFVGHEPDIVPDTFGATLPAIRAQLGYRDDELVCVVAVGGSGVGKP